MSWQATDLTLLGLAALLVLGAALDRWRTRRQAIRDTADEQERRLENQAMWLANDLCADPVCCPEDGWLCTVHQPPRGKHHAVWSIPLDDQPAAVILAVVTDVRRRQK